MMKSHTPAKLTRFCHVVPSLSSASPMKPQPCEITVLLSAIVVKQIGKRAKIWTSGELALDTLLHRFCYEYVILLLAVLQCLGLTRQLLHCVTGSQPRKGAF